MAESTDVDWRSEYSKLRRTCEAAGRSAGRDLAVFGLGAAISGGVAAGLWRWKKKRGCACSIKPLDASKAGDGANGNGTNGQNGHGANGNGKNGNGGNGNGANGKNGNGANGKNGNGANGNGNQGNGQGGMVPGDS